MGRKLFVELCRNVGQTLTRIKGDYTRRPSFLFRQPLGDKHELAELRAILHQLVRAARFP